MAPPLQPLSSMDFGQASVAVIDYLQAAVPMSFWSVTRHEGDRQVYLAVNDSAYGLRPGDSCRWSDSMCQFVADDTQPAVIPDVDLVAGYATAGVRAALPISAYVGVPLRSADGELFGTLCGIDPRTQPPELTDHTPLVALLAQLLSAIMHADRQLTQTQRAAERLAQDAEIDVLTNLYNRRGWNRFLATEEARYRRFGDTGTIIVVDLDNLKQVNDRQGHDVGDRHITRAAQVLLDNTRAADIVARLGGDEFGILATKTPSHQADTLIDRLEQHLAAAGIPASIGHAPYSIDGGLAGAWRNADQAMYRNKQQRKSNPPPAASQRQSSW